jgi:hypothetical protein
MEKDLIAKEQDNAMCANIVEFKKRMLLWDSPVEYVNNMYGCHPDENGIDYFKKVYSN